MLCRRCRKNQITSAGLCEQCHALVISHTREIATAEFDARQALKKEDLASLNWVYNRLLISIGCGAVFLMSFIATLLEDPKEDLFNCFLLSIISVCASVAILSLLMLLIEFLIEFLSSVSLQEEMQPRHYQIAKFFFRFIPLLFSALGCMGIIALIHLNIDSLNWQPLAAYFVKTEDDSATGDKIHQLP